MKIEYIDISHEEFEHKLGVFKSCLDVLFTQSNDIEKKLLDGLAELNYE